VIRSCADFYIASDITLNNMKDYEVVCKTLLLKYPRINEKVVKMCQLENASSKSVKRLNPHVYYFEIETVLS